MSEHREETRRQKDELWDKTFADNEDLGADGHLSRTAHRRQRSHNSTVTTVLIVLIIALAAAPVIYWVNHKQSFNHPIRTEQRATSAVSSHKKTTRQAKTSTKKKRQQSSAISSSQQEKSTSSVASSAVSSTSSSVSSSSSTASSSSTSHQGRYVTVQRGQSVYRVAEQNGLTAQELARLNNMTIKTPIHPGQQLRVR